MKQRSLIAWRYYATGLLGLLLSGCAHYQPRPLPTAPDLTKAPDLTVSAKQFSLPGLAPHPVSPHGLDATTVMLLAVLHNPDLKAARLQAGVASAQLLQAGLLPDPQFSVSPAFSASNYGGGLGLSEEIQALITRGAAKAAAAANQKQVNLNILWQEWQVAAQAQQLFIQICADDRLGPVYTEADHVLSAEYRRDRSAMERGDATSAAVSADLVALNDAQSNLRQLEMQAKLARQQLNAILGLQPEVQLHFIDSAEIAPLTPAAFHAAIANLPQRRADLLALQAGYQSQEENLRLAVLAQFPAMSVGVNMKRDPIEGENDFGPAVSLTLPVFNRNRGQIALQRATRAVLWQTYQARLDAAESQARQIWSAMRIQSLQIRDMNAQLPELKQVAGAAQLSYQQNNMNASAYVSLESSYLSKRAETIRLQAALDSEQSALRLLLGLSQRAASGSNSAHLAPINSLVRTNVRAINFNANRVTCVP